MSTLAAGVLGILMVLVASFVLGAAITRRNQTATEDAVGFFKEKALGYRSFLG